jgi:hypothetical protein
MTRTIQLTFTDEQTAHFLAWRSQVEAETGTPLGGVVFACLVTRKGEWQILVRPSTAQDFKLKNIARSDGTYDTFAPYEEVLAEYDALGFASTQVRWQDVGITLHLCDGTVLGVETTPRCYVECRHDPQQPLLPFRVSAQPALLEEDVVLQIFPYTPLAPALTQVIAHFIRTNADVLLQHWRGEMSSVTLLDRLHPPGSGYDSTEVTR